MYTYIYVHAGYGVATISMLLKIIVWQDVVSFIGLFCKRDI